MRVDLHNHTPLYMRNPRQGQKNLENLCLQILKSRSIDAFAITNYHEIETALALAKKLPGKIIVGCEYQVFEQEACTVHVIALDLTPQLHQNLLHARLRGVKHFTSFLKEKKIAYFLARIAWGMHLANEKTAVLLDQFLPHFDAIKVLSSHPNQESKFASQVCSYYQLAPVGGSDSIISEYSDKAYTKAKADSHSIFLQALRRKEVSVGRTQELALQKKIPPMKWHQRWEEFWPDNFQWSALRESLIPFFQWIPQANHHYHLQKRDKSILPLQTAFIDYLKSKETQQIFQSKSFSPEEKSFLWQERISKIHKCFS